MPTLATQGTSWPEWLPLALAFKKVLLAHDNDEPNTEGECVGDLAATSLVPALRSYGAEPERYPPLSKDWNQDLQEQGLERQRRIIAGESVSEPAQAAVEITADQSVSPRELMPVVVPEPRAETTVEACPGAVPVEQPERAEVDELLGWLSGANLPHQPFQLWPWVNVTDVARLVVTLQTELSAQVMGPRWRSAAEDLRQVARLYRGDVGGEAQQSRAPPLRHMPVLMSHERAGTEQAVARRVQDNSSRVG